MGLKLLKLVLLCKRLGLFQKLTNNSPYRIPKIAHIHRPYTNDDVAGETVVTTTKEQPTSTTVVTVTGFDQIHRNENTDSMWK